MDLNHSRMAGVVNTVVFCPTVDSLKLTRKKKNQKYHFKNKTSTGTDAFLVFMKLPCTSASYKY